MQSQLVIPISEPSQIGEARRAVARLGEAAALNEVDMGRLAIIATELGTNLVRHAQHGELCLQPISSAAGTAIEILSIDSGPGIANIEHALTDGYSTAGTAGNGLGAIKRLSDEFEIYSQLQRGTVVMSRVSGSGQKSPVDRSIVWGAMAKPAPHETLNGDTWRIFHADGQFALMVADGLGHGPFAAEAAEKVAEIFERNPRATASVFLQTAHQAASGTRGAAVAIACLNAAGQVWRYAGVGNISGTLCSDNRTRGMCSHNGTIGVQVRKIQEFEYPHIDHELLIMHSDGLKTRWAFDEYPGLTTKHPALIAAVLYRDFERGRDDLTVVVVRLSSFKASLS